MASDLFAPPTADEIAKYKSAPSPDLFAPPSQDELEKADPSYKKTSFADKAQTALENYGNVMTLGYLPQLQSMSEQIMAPVFGSKNEDYVKDRDANIARIQQESEENPKSALAGKGVGILASSMMLPGGSASESIGAAALKGAGTSAGYGYLQNPGDVKGVYDPNQMGARAMNAAKGAAMGGIASGVTKGLLNLKDAPEALEQTANEQAVAQTHPMLKDYRAMDAKGNEQALGQWLRDKGVVRAGDTFDDVVEKANAIKDQAGNQLDDLYTSASKPFDEANAAPKELPVYSTKDPNQIGPDYSGTPGILARQKTIGPYNEGTGAASKSLDTREGVTAPSMSVEKGDWTDYFTPRTPKQNTNLTEIIGPKDEISGLPTGGHPDLPGFNPSRDKNEILQTIQSDPSVANSPRAKAILSTASKYLDDQSDRFGDRVLSPRETQLLKTGLDQEINYARNPLSKEPTSEGAFSPMRSYLSDKIESQFQHLEDSGADQGLVDKLRQANTDYGNASRTVDMAGDYVQRMNANQKAGLSDWLAASTGGAVGTGAGMVMGGEGEGSKYERGGLGLLGALAGGVGNHVMRTRGPGLIMGAAETAQPFAELAQPIGQAASATGITPGIASKAATLGLLNKKKDKNQ